jgi:hypothetical protein
VVVLLLAGLLWPASALADSASIVSFQDAGGGQITVTYTVTSTSGTPGQVLYPGGPVFGRNYSWYAYMAEEHASRPCNPAWANYLRHVVPFHEESGSVTSTVTFRPFFPRQIKLCVYLNNTAGHRAVLEQVFSIPAGYGVQRSSGYNCSHFSRYSAQDYYWLYPGDPSGLDADRDGAACEENTGAQPGPQIPAEPQPSGATHATCTDGIDNDGDGPLDLADFDWNQDAYYPAGSRCDHVNVGGTEDEDDGQQTPLAPVRLLCNKFVGSRGRNVAYRTKRPRRCAVWRAHWAHYQALTFIKARWTGWGRSTARARVTLTGNSGFRARGRIKAYRLRQDCTGRFRVYTRVKLLRGGVVKRPLVFRPDTCPG